MPSRVAPSHTDLIEREMRAVAHIIAGCPCPGSTQTHAVMAEARLTPMEERRILAARLLARALSLPPTDPLRETAEASAPSHLTVVRGWRTLGRQMLHIRAADSGAFGCVSLASRFDLRALRILKGYFESGDDTRHQTGCKPDPSEPTLCYRASNPDINPNTSQNFIFDVTNDVIGRDKCKTLDFLTLLALLGRAGIAY